MIGQTHFAGNSYNTSVAMEFFRFAGKPKSIAKGKKIFAENQRGIPFLLMPNRMYLLLDGEVAIFAGDRPVATVRPGQIFGEMASIDQGPRSGTAVTKSACRVISLDNRQLQTALGKYPEFALMLMSVMIGRLRESIGRLGGSDSFTAGTQSRESAPLRKDLIDDLARVLASDAHLSYETGDTIVREGQIGVLMYVVLKGKVAIRVGGKLVENVGPGGLFGEMALVDRSPRLASAVAETNCKLLAINRNAFLNLVKHSRRFAASLLAAVSARARFMASR
ncbi:MAG TPA: cyclic nucleotide-binding domain-containing protein [Burkholderiales bacterium]|nr:cyclic nucleotide-binding domain-containing protein [Burkholderiales bacterium]